MAYRRTHSTNAPSRTVPLRADACQERREQHKQRHTTPGDHDGPPVRHCVPRGASRRRGRPAEGVTAPGAETYVIALDAANISTLIPRTTAL